MSSSYFGGSAHGWSDEDDTYDASIMTHLLSINEYDKFMVDPFEVWRTLPMELLQAYLTTSYWIESLHNPAPRVLEDTTLPLPVLVGSYKIKVHLICSYRMQTRGSEKGMAILSATNPLGATLSKTENDALTDYLRSQLLAGGKLMGEGRGIGLTKLAGEGVHSEPFCLAGPITLEDATAIAKRLNQLAFVFTGTKEKTRLVFTGLRPSPEVLGSPT